MPIARLYVLFASITTFTAAAPSSSQHAAARSSPLSGRAHRAFKLSRNCTGDVLRLGESARAALTSRGFAEMQRLGLALGAKAETLAGLSGLGDLVLTCASATSRNFSLGQALGEGGRAEDVLSQRLSVSEGATSAEAVCALAARARVDMPICAAVADILAGRHDVDTAIQNLMARPLAHE